MTCDFGYSVFWKQLDVGTVPCPEDDLLKDETLCKYNVLFIQWHSNIVHLVGYNKTGSLSFIFHICVVIHR